jgi:energy-coupling factor transporter ATP-binding protein EcfA2
MVTHRPARESEASLPFDPFDFDNETTSARTSRDAHLVSVQDQGWLYPGARWWKFDFHTHTPASADYGKGPNQVALRQITPADWLLDFMRAEADCVAITDHNSGSWIDRLRQALHDLELGRHPDFRPLHLFPGVEITANGGIHVLGILDTGSASVDVAALLGAVGYHGERGASDVAAEKAPLGVVEAICNAGGIPILAHVDEPSSGAWGLKGNTLAPLLDFGGLFAMEVVDPYSEPPELYRQRKLAWSDVLGSDSHHPADGTGDRFPGSHYTWVKMAKPSLEGLRLALLDGNGFSIRRSDAQELFDPFATPKHCIESIEITNARYMGRGKPAKIDFSPWLNALVGGRGTGKSTVVHALRLAARREGELTHLEERSGPRLTFERFNRVPSNRMDEGGLTAETKIRWTVMRDGVRHRVHWQQDGAGIVVEDESGSGNWVPSPAQTVTPDRFPLRVFSQGQIAELAGNSQQALLRVIDEAAGVYACREQLNEACNAFFASRARLRELDEKLGRQDHLKVALQDVERKLRHFEEAGHADVLTTYRNRNRQCREANRQLDTAGMVAQRIEAIAADLQPEDLPEGLIEGTSWEDQQLAELMMALGVAVNSAAQGMRDVARRLREAVETQREALMKSSWQASVVQATGDYEGLVEALKSEGVSDPNEYGQLVQERQRLEGEMKNLESEKEERNRWVDQSQERLREVQEARRAISVARHEFLSKALAQNQFVRIDIHRYGNEPHAIERSLRETLDVLDDRFQDDILALEGGRPARGTVAKLLEGSAQEELPRSAQVEQRLDDFKHRLTMACSGLGDFGGHFNNYLRRHFEQGPDFLDRLLTWFPEDGLSVTYSRAGDGTDFLPIAQASAGQRSAAMLAFLLAHGEEPLVLDQPEDDLDNHLIYDLVVRQIRENKLRRQIIVVTHNPNVVVNGDAEILHALDFAQGQCLIRQSGSLQEEAMRAEVCRVMEGGREAFERRYRRLGKEPTRV